MIEIPADVSNELRVQRVNDSVVIRQQRAIQCGIHLILFVSGLRWFLAGFLRQQLTSSRLSIGVANAGIH